MLLVWAILANLLRKWTDSNFEMYFLLVWNFAMDFIFISNLVEVKNCKSIFGILLEYRYGWNAHADYLFNIILK